VDHDVRAALRCDRRAMARPSITIVLELDESADSPAGSARLPDGTRRSFHGWLGLTEAIDSLAGISARSAAALPGAPHDVEADRPTTQQERKPR
jgi:hypothetical protein